MREKLQSLRQLALRGQVAALTALPLLASAQVTDPFDTAIATATTKVESYGAALVGFAAVAIVFYIGIKFIKKVPKAA